MTCSAVASAAYRSTARLRDERIDSVQGFSPKRGVVHSEKLLPENAPEQWLYRERLWNDVEALEVRKDTQLARVVEFSAEAVVRTLGLSFLQRAQEGSGICMALGLGTNSRMRALACRRPPTDELQRSQRNLIKIKGRLRQPL